MTQTLIKSPLPLMGRGQGWGDLAAARRFSSFTPTQPSPIEGEGFTGRER